MVGFSFHGTQEGDFEFTLEPDKPVHRLNDYVFIGPEL
jgi:hypothetical protein